MSETANRQRSGASLKASGEEEDPAAMERRIFRGMCVTVVLAVLLSAALAEWRVTTGLLIGGTLSLFNHHWLRTSIAAAFDATDSGRRPKLRVARYILRYLIVGSVVAAAYWLDVASLVALLAGLCSFVVAALIEGLMQLFFAFVHREET